MMQSRLVYILAILSLCLDFCFAAKDEPKTKLEGQEDLETVMLIEIYSAGSRAPVNSNLFDEKWIKEAGLGRITGNGMRQQYNLGSAIRSQFKEFFERIPDQSMVKVFSSSRSRSLISAVSHNHGLFPSGTRWNPEIMLSDAMKSMTKQLPNWNGSREANLKQKMKNEFFSEPVAVPLDTIE